MSDEFKPGEMNPEMAGIIAERLLAAHKNKHREAPQNPAEAFKAGAVAALMARVRIDGVDWVTRCPGGLCPDCGSEPWGAPGVAGPEGCSDPPGPCGNPPEAVGMTGITDNPYDAKLVAAHGRCGGKGDGE